MKYFSTQCLCRYFNSCGENGWVIQDEGGGGGGWGWAYGSWNVPLAHIPSSVIVYYAFEQASGEKDSLDKIVYCMFVIIHKHQFIPGLQSQ